MQYSSPRGWGRPLSEKLKLREYKVAGPGFKPRKEGLSAGSRATFLTLYIRCEESYKIKMLVLKARVTG